MEELPERANTEKKTFYGITNDYIFGTSSMQGWRPSMEDYFSIIIALPEDPSTSFFGVFDGHGGTLISEFVSKNIFQYIVTDPDYMEGDVKLGITNAFLRLDNYMMKDPQYGRSETGSTAIVVLIKSETLYCANLGDSRAVAFVQGDTLALSTDHKPNLPLERRRIVQAGCFVSNDRVNDNLALSRAFGDFKFKQNRRKSMREQAIVSLPDVQEWPISDQWEFVVLACDGIWDVMTNEQVCHFIRMRMSRSVRPDVICEQLLEECLCKGDPYLQLVGTDNMTVIIVVFMHSVNKPYVGIRDHRSSYIKYLSSEH